MPRLHNLVSCAHVRHSFAGNGVAFSASLNLRKGTSDPLEPVVYTRLSGHADTLEEADDRHSSYPARVRRAVIPTPGLLSVQRIYIATYMRSLRDLCNGIFCVRNLTRSRSRVKLTGLFCWSVEKELAANAPVHHCPSQPDKRERGAVAEGLL